MIPFNKVNIIMVIVVSFLWGCAASLADRHKSVEETQDQKVLARIANDDDDWTVRLAAVQKLTDQTVLAKIVSDDKDGIVRDTAMQKITDQAILAKIATNDKNKDIRMAAVQKLTDQAIIAKIATKDEDWFVRTAAIVKLTDRTMLTTIANESDFLDRETAKRTLISLQSDQTALAQIATKDENWSFRVMAVMKLTDQSLLTKIAIDDDNLNVRIAAVEKLTDQELLTKVAVTVNDPVSLYLIISKLNNPNPIFMLKIGNTECVTRDATQSIARMNLAIQEPRIKSHFPALLCVINFSSESRKYSNYRFKDNNLRDSFGNYPGEAITDIQGEIITFKLNQKDSTIAEVSWSAEFPNEIPSTTGYIRANVSGEYLLKKLLHMSVFTADDLYELIHSSIPEVRIGGVSNLSDLTLLAKVANEDKCNDVRIAAEYRIKELVGKR
jgi:hypothetical protein